MLVSHASQESFVNPKLSNRKHTLPCPAKKVVVMIIIIMKWQQTKITSPKKHIHVQSNVHHIQTHFKVVRL